MIHPLLKVIDISDIRFNVVLLHAYALLIGGVFLFAVILPHEDPTIRSQLLPASLTIVFGLINIFAARKKHVGMVSFNLIFWFGMLLYRSFQVVDESGFGVVLNMAFLTVIMLFSIFFNKRAGFSVLATVLICNLLRWYLENKGLYEPKITENTGLVESFFLALITLYAITLIAYYQFQMYRLIKHLWTKNNRNKKLMLSLQKKRAQSSQHLKYIQQFRQKTVPEMVEKALQEKNLLGLMESDDAVFNRMKSFSTDMDTELRRNEQQMQLDTEVKS